MQRVTFEPTFAGWRSAARDLLASRTRPDDVVWDGSWSQSLGDFTAEDAEDRRGAAIGSPLRSSASSAVDALAEQKVPKEFLRIAAAVACHRGDEKWAALYRVLWRLTSGEPRLLEVATDPDVHRLLVMRKAVKRAVHKMHAFVRFRAVAPPGAARPEDAPAYEDGIEYVAWFEPPHPVLEPAAPFFARRFASMRWTILTPDRTARWDGERLSFGPGVPREQAPRDDALEELWKAYYANVFNPARLSLDTMRAEMPVGYWRNLPEAVLVRDLAREAPGRVRAMLQRALGPAEDMPEQLRLKEQREPALSAAKGPSARACPERQRGGYRTVGSFDERDLTLPGDDVVHDPGTVVARERARAVAHHAPDGFTIEGTRIVHGTASWTDPTLLAPGVLYPEGIDSAESRLRYYASRFPLVEVDATYYSPPTREMAVRWAERTPEGFSFDIKAWAPMTGHPVDLRKAPDWLRRALPAALRSAHRLRPGELPPDLVHECWRRFLHALQPLAGARKLGALLLQYPRWFAPTREAAGVLRQARERLGDTLGAVEFRNPAWVTGRIAERTFALLEELGLAYVIVDAPPGTRSSMPPVMRATSPELAIVRLHGRRTSHWEARNDLVSERYRYLYDPTELAQWTRRLLDFIDVAQLKQGVHVVHNNCHANYGTTNAEEIAAMLIEADRVRREMGRAATG